MYRIFAILLLVAAGVTTSGLSTLATRLSASNHGNGIRAIIVHGKLVSAPILIADFEMATALHDEVTRAQKYGDAYPQSRLKRRPCLEMAVFLPGSRTARVPLQQLQPNEADAKWLYYPAVENEPAVIGRTAVSKAQLDALSGFGVPVQVGREAGATCN